MSLVSKAFSDIITFSRSSNATRIGPDGLVQYAPHNLFQRSQDFDNAYWGKYTATVSANTTAAPDGTITADTLVENTATDTHFAYVSVTLSATPHTFSVYYKIPSARKLALYHVETNTGRQFDSVGTQAAGLFNAPSGWSITSVGNGWYRASITITASSGSNEFRFWMVKESDNAINYTGDGTSGIYLWGAQLSIGTRALDYTPTTSAAVYGPRFDYDPVTLAAKGLLIEEQRTNISLYSGYSASHWTKDYSSVTANSVVAPDGTLSASTLVENTTTDFHLTYPSGISSSAATYTASIFLKQAGRQYAAVQIYIDGATSRYTVLVDLSNGSFVASNNVGTPTNTSYAISPVGNGWYRVSVTAAHTTSTMGIAIGAGNSATPSYTVGFPAYTGNGGNAIHFWGAQVEAGSFATSYIPTLASSVTRSADVASVNTLSPWWNASAGTFFIENTFGNYGNQPIALSDQVAVGNAWIYGSVGVIQAYIVGPGLNISSGVSVAANTYAKSAFAFGADGKAISVNGSTPVVSANTTSPTASTQLSLGNWPGGPYYINGHIKRVSYYPRKLSSAELQALTA